MLLLQQCYLNETIQCILFANGFYFPLAIRSVCVVCINNKSLRYCWVVFRDYSLFSRSPAEGRLGCFQFRAIMSKAAMNTSVQVLHGRKLLFSVSDYLLKDLKVAWEDSYHFKVLNMRESAQGSPMDFVCLFLNLLILEEEARVLTVRDLKI